MLQLIIYIVCKSQIVIIHMNMINQFDFFSQYLSYSEMSIIIKFTLGGDSMPNHWEKP